MKEKILVFFVLSIFLLSTIGAGAATGFKINVSTNKEEPLIYTASTTTHIVIVEGPSGSGYLYNYYTRDIARLYHVIQDVYGYTDDQIDVLFEYESYTENEEFTGYMEDKIDYRSTENNLITVLNQFKSGGSKEMNSEDMLFLVWIDHGGGGQNAFFPMGEGTVNDYEFANYIEGIDGTLVFVFQPCNSGGFIDDVSGPNRIVMSSTNPREGEGGWIRLFYEGLSGDADTDPEIGNQDGIVSFEEAHHHAARYVYERQTVHSLLDDNGDGNGHHYTSSGYDINDPSKDAYIAARTFLGGAALTANAGGPYVAEPGVSIQFSGQASGGETPYEWTWDFGDDSPGSHEQNPTHTYDSEGEYIVTLTVKDNENEIVEDTTVAAIGVFIPDLDCTGKLEWPKVKTGSTARGEISVSNIGDEYSSLDWEVIEYPDWGEWTFTPTIGYDLKPVDGAKTVAVSVIAPNEEPQTYEGQIKIVNMNDDSDFVIINTVLTTPKIRQKPALNNFINKLFSNFPLIANLFNYT